MLYMFGMLFTFCSSFPIATYVAKDEYKRN